MFEMFKVISTQEREREEIARELHDGVVQSLIALKINLGMLPIKPEDEKLTGHAKKTIKMVDDTIGEIREVIGNFRSVELKKEGLLNSVRVLCEKLEGLCNIKFNCNITEKIPHWGEAEELNIYRIIQECLMNVVKHSAATEVDLNMLRLNNRLFLISIIDNGIGFDINSVSSGFGLTTIKERSYALNAKMLINSEEGHGTTVIFEVPYEEN